VPFSFDFLICHDVFFWGCLHEIKVTHSSTLLRQGKPNFVPTNCYSFCSMKNISFFLPFLIFLTCVETKSPKKELELRFLDNYVVPEGMQFQNTEIGGLSGIDYFGGTYYLICDQPKTPRFYKANISIK